MAGPASVYLAATALSRAAAILLIPLYTRALSLEEYGDYALAQTLIALGGQPMSLGLIAAMSRFYFEPGDPAMSRARAGTAARWLVVVSLLSIVLLGALVLLIRPARSGGIFGRWELLCIVWASGAFAIAAVPSQYFRSARRPFVAACFQVAEFVCTVGAGLFMVLILKRGLRGAIEASALSASVLALTSILFILTSFKGPLSLAALRAALHFSLPFVPHQAGNQLQLISDRWAMKITGNAAALGAYSVAAQLASPISMVIASWNDAVTPGIGEAFRKNSMRGVASRFPKYQRSFPLLALAAGVALCVALPIIAHFLAPAFREALWIVPFLAASYVVESLYYPNTVVVFYANRPDLIPKITLTAGFLNVALNAVLVTMFGVYGAIASRTLSMGFRSGLMWFVARPMLRAASDGSNDAIG